ncbi:MAG: winged helix-turn-helix domain-containing protein, partial [Acetanaerobacterium sp.]
RVGAHIARFERLTSLNSAPQERFLAFGNIKISQQSHRVFLGGEEVRFTGKEFELLYFLASNPDVVFSKDTLFERIWGLDAVGDISTITVHIKRIREKIEADPGNPQYIQTIWGVGYRFSC